MKWYNFRNGGKVLHLAAGGAVYTPTADATPIVEEGGTGADIPTTGYAYTGSGSTSDIDYDATADYYNDVGFTNQVENPVEAYVPVNTQYQGNIGAGGELYTPDQIAAIEQPQTFFDIHESNQVLQDSGATVPQLNQEVPPEILQAAVQDAEAPEFVDHAGTAPVVDIDGGAETLVQLDNTVDAAPVVSHDTTAPIVDAGAASGGAPSGVSAQPVQGTVNQYMSTGADGLPRVFTGIPHGGHAANAISSYLSGANAQQYNDQIAGQLNEASTWGGVDQEQLDQYVADQAAAGQAYVDAAAGGGNDEVDISGGATTVTDEFGGEITADNEFEAGLADDIVNIINEGGINPETGDPVISAGPNVLSAADEGAFGIGSDYNEEFVENYNANYDHAEANPTGMTTGTPLYDQGYVGLGVDPIGDAVGGLVNNSTIGLIGEAITGNPLMADVSSLLPPEESFSNYGSDDDDGPSHNVNNDGDPTNDTGNAGWGFTSIADMFDGGGPGASGDSYSGGIHGDDTVGDTSEGVGSIFDDWFGGSDDSSSSSSSSDSGSSSSSSSSGGGYSCYVATALNEAGYWTTQKKLRLLSWCIKSKPEGKLDTKLWRNGYCWFGKEIIAPRVGHPLIRWLSDGFYESVVEKRVTVKSMLGLAFFYIPSYKMGVWKMLRGKLEEIDRT